MRPIFFVIVLFVLESPRLCIADMFGSGAFEFEIDFVAIGNPGNTADMSGNPSPAGRVDYVYEIGKYEISRQMVENANRLGGLQLLLADMTLRGGNRPEIPATGLRRFMVARFVNWLNTSSGFAPAYKFSTDPGDSDYDPFLDEFMTWSPGDVGYNAANPMRNLGARYFLPTVDEWYKAAHYDPAKNGGAGGYWKYGTGSDTPPTPVESGMEPNTAVYDFEFFSNPNQGPADATMAGGLSPYGVMGMSGNVFEWEETISGPLGWARGGAWGTTDFGVASTNRGGTLVHFDTNPGVGFRVVQVPETTSGLIYFVIGFGSVRLRRRRH